MTGAFFSTIAAPHEIVRSNRCRGLERQLEAAGYRRRLQDPNSASVSLSLCEGRQRLASADAAPPTIALPSVRMGPTAYAVKFVSGMRDG